MTTTDDLMTIAEACAYLKVTRATLYRWARHGRLPLVRLGARATRVSLRDLRRLASPDEAEVQASSKLSEAAFADDWDNDDDAVYDNWREIYGVPAR